MVIRSKIGKVLTAVMFCFAFLLMNDTASFATPLSTCYVDVVGTDAGNWVSTGSGCINADHIYANVPGVGNAYAWYPSQTAANNDGAYTGIICNGVTCTVSGQTFPPGSSHVFAWPLRATATISVFDVNYNQLADGILGTAPAGGTSFALPVPVTAFFGTLEGFATQNLFPSFFLLFAVIVGISMTLRSFKKWAIGGPVDHSFKAHVTQSHGKRYVKRNPGLFK